MMRDREYPVGYTHDEGEVVVSSQDLALACNTCCLQHLCAVLQLWGYDSCACKPASKAQCSLQRLPSPQ